MSKLVVKDNALMNASYNLDLVEQRLILLAIVEARESGKGINANDPLTVHAESYINQFGVARQTAYQALKDACDDLFARQFSYQEINERGNTENVRSRWVSEVRYVDAEATVKLIFAPIVIPLITRLEERFTQYEMKQISELSTGYAIRLYELLICWRTTGKTPIIELADFRQKMGVLDAEYQRMYDLKKYVLEPSLKQINEHTDITASYEQHKKGRTITGFSFKFKQKKKTEAETPKNSDSSPHIKKPSQIPTNIVKQPENAKKDDLGHRASKITGLIMSNGLADRFKRGDESVMDMMKRIKEEITTDATADQWQSKLEEFGVVF
ncbi:RepB family plasmid replication initiator protein [Acinetobacter baumannii]|jgi:plasmid replication initiation protein|nr:MULTISPECIES: replication initiation protein RepM [Acinetobacter]MDV2456636.1 replication initiation protein RepM [Acinetobacter towneri]OTL48823.1 RepB family plasmid replication initiator protein [Acinetobacter baumannii]